MSMEIEPFSQTVVAGYSDSFNGREVRPSSMMTFLEETAAEHCADVGRDIFTLLENGGGWVLAGGGMRMKKYPRYGETIRIETWISSWKRFTGFREYRLYAEDGSILGEAGSRWVFWDISTRKPMAIPPIFLDHWHVCPDSPYRRIFPASGTPSFFTKGEEQTDHSALPAESVQLEVRRGDVDLYGHLHNTTYLDWLMEAVPESLWSDAIPMDLSIQFFGEARLGESVIFNSTVSENGWFHEVKRVGDGKLLVQGFSRWNEKSTELSA